MPYKLRSITAPLLSCGSMADPTNEIDPAAMVNIQPLAIGQARARAIFLNIFNLVGLVIRQ